MTRQREWQKKKRAQGLCPICGQKSKEGHIYCINHHEMRKVYTRNLNRKKKGIPLDAPLRTRASKNIANKSIQATGDKAAVA